VSPGVLYADLGNGMLASSSKLQVVHARAEHEVWKHYLTESWRIKPNCTGEQLRFRRFIGNGVPSAQIHSTAAQISTAGARRSHAPVKGSITRSKTLQAGIQMPIGTSGHLDGSPDNCIQEVAAQRDIDSPSQGKS